MSTIKITLNARGETNGSNSTEPCDAGADDENFAWWNLTRREYD